MDAAAAAANKQDDWSALFHPYTDGVHGCAACRFSTCPAVAGLASPPQWWGLACAVLELTCMLQVVALAVVRRKVFGKLLHGLGTICQLGKLMAGK